MQNIDFYKQFSLFTYPGCYLSKLKKLPNDIEKIGNLVRRNFIHRTTLRDGNTGSNLDRKYGDMTKIPWWQQPEDDYLVTAGAMLTELYRKNKKGLIKNRKEAEKLILTCRYVSVMMASILKSKDMACRVRSGFAPYFHEDGSWDHWINQYYDHKKKRWVTFDVDGSWHDLDFDPYNIPEGKFDFAAKSWLDVRSGKVKPKRFQNAGGFEGVYPVAWALLYDFHCAMNREIIYLHGSDKTSPKDYFAKKPISDKYLKQLDKLAKLMINPDENFEKLQKVWATKKNFRLLKGGLL